MYEPTSVESGHKGTFGQADEVKGEEVNYEGGQRSADPSFPQR